MTLSSRPPPQSRLSSFVCYPIGISNEVVRHVCFTLSRPMKREKRKKDIGKVFPGTRVASQAVDPVASIVAKCTPWSSRPPIIPMVRTGIQKGFAHPTRSESHSWTCMMRECGTAGHQVMQRDTTTYMDESNRPGVSSTQRTVRLQQQDKPSIYRNSLVNS
ncbi:hypothetical protein LZ30DRAFT_147599 [Colletotrichum cereale]|nr:hypothetical protein LZ30DRAFT_147599 [Colletotrichum cereale]